MKRLTVREIDGFVDCCINENQSDIKQRTSCESSALNSKRMKVDKDSSDISLIKSPTSSENSSDQEGTAVGIVMAAGDSPTDEEGEEERVKMLSHGLISVIGQRRAMEDAVTVAIGEIKGYDFFAVYDGHGGAKTANKCRERLHVIIREELKGRNICKGGGFEYWEDLMTASFMKMDEEVSVGGEKEGPAAAEMRTMGSTAVVVMVGKDELVVANCGDSRAVLCRGGVAVPLSRDHKPDRPDETERVEAAGGRIINWNGSRVLGVLATSRSIGDEYMKPYVISEPEVTVNERMESDDFLIIASDGLWDVVTNEFACEVVRRCLNGQLRVRFSEDCIGTSAAEASTFLAELAMARGSKDNISVIVVVLKSSS
ncbi:protein phosphatase 2C 51-like [Pistacia vera]|uniref:protein phosphatase 2C 51-like n=1 Tax=Pistacia vera TaxID=55513 RepID=UPI0012630844|nr:protein phosphatase 2C 51-like [Pistacia vera]